MGHEGSGWRSKSAGEHTNKHALATFLEPIAGGTDGMRHGMLVWPVSLSNHHQ